MEQNECIQCKNSNCLFKFNLSKYPKEIEKFIIQNGLNVYLENMPVKGFYIVQRGCINEYHIDKKGQRKICHTAKSGEIFGHKDFNAEKHLYSAIATEDSSICLIDKKTLLLMCKTNPSLSLQLINFYSNELNKSDKKYQKSNQYG